MGDRFSRAAPREKLRRASLRRYHDEPMGRAEPEGMGS